MNEPNSTIVVDNLPNFLFRLPNGAILCTDSGEPMIHKKFIIGHDLSGNFIKRKYKPRYQVLIDRQAVFEFVKDHITKNHVFLNEQEGYEFKLDTIGIHIETTNEKSQEKEDTYYRRFPVTKTEIEIIKALRKCGQGFMVISSTRLLDPEESEGGVYEF
jgi:hypothetical protein